MPLTDAIALDTEGMPRALRRRLERAASKSRSIEDLRRRVRPEDHDALDRALRKTLISMNTPRKVATDGPFPGTSNARAALAWLEARCPRGDADTALWEAIGARLPLDYGYYYDVTVRGYIEDGGGRFPRIDRAIARWADQRAKQRDAAEAAHQQAEVWRSVQPAPPLREAWHLLRQAHLDFIDQRGLPLRSVPGENMVLDELACRLSIPGAAYLCLEDKTPRLEVIRSSPDLVHALGRLLDVLTAPHEHMLRDRLLKVLSQSPDSRLLDRLARASARQPLPEDEDKRLLGWEWLETEGGWDLAPVQCRAAKRGGSYVTRRLDYVDPCSVLFQDPTEARVLGLCGQRYPDELAVALRLLVGHPRVFYGGHTRKVPLRVREGRLGVGVRRRGQAIVVRVELDGAPLPDGLRSVETPGLVAGVVGDQLVFGQYEGPLHPWVVDLGRRELVFSETRAQEDLQSLLGGLVQAIPVDVDPHVLGHPLAGDPRPRVACRWQDGTLDVRVQVAPAHDAPASPPGQGSPVLIVQRGEQVHSIHRDLAAEPRRVREQLADLEGLILPDAAEVVPFHWSIQDVQQALDVLEGLRANRDSLQLVWEGDPPVPPGSASATHLRLRVGSGTDWFGLSGRLSADGHEVDLKAVLQAAADGHRYLSVGKDRWTKIESSLRDKLTALAAVQEKGQLGIVQGAVIDELQALGANLEASRGWLDRRAAAAASANLKVVVPPELRATLRSYQEEGFRWLARLATWAPGACLADDMGLGKTVQSLALLLHRRDTGPALVVCPTSVVDNWLAEAARFAPTLRIAPYRGSSRDALLTEDARPDVLVTSYGLLTRDASALASVSWGTVVLDEAQAIRNPTAQRSKAARSLQAGFRVALSGTPIQNRTTELWSVLAFAVPGLLGSLPHFQESFALPIDANRDEGRRELLARLISPFVLRRTKHLVARELPGKTEQVISVTLSEEERALYDHERRAAVQRLQKAGSKRGFRMLQELTRLRQLACHPALVDATSTLTSSKLRRVVSTLVQLRAADQAALVFSSFTSHLALLRQALEERGFHLRYLDGSTPPGRRTEEIAAFQAGDGDAFLISLKAGGTGLNLTRATYVLHLDPWWNPAAEDQATDRAHRIGQTDPVTVYRFVSEGTIEEQIVALHAHKRELASALLGHSGSDEIPDTDTLMRLLEEGRSVASAASAPSPRKPALLPAPDPEPPSPTRSARAAAPHEPVSEGATPSSPDSIAETVQAFRTFLERDMTASSAQAYARCAHHALTWSMNAGLTPQQGVPEYAALASRGEGTTRSCTRLARPMAARLVPWLAP